MKLKGFFLTPLFLLFGLCHMGMGQDATESHTNTVKGSMQIEVASGYEAFTNERVRTKAYALGSLMIFYGLSNTLEVRLGVEHQEESIRTDNVRGDGVLSGYAPLLVGLGLDVTKEKGVLPKLGFVIDVAMPNTGGNDFKTNRAEVVLNSIFYHTLSKKANLTYNIGALFGEVDSYFYSMAYYKNVTEVFGFYAELNGNFPKDFSAEHYWNLGLFYMISPKVQIEGIVGTGIATDQDIYLKGRITIVIPDFKKNNKRKNNK